MSANIDTMMHVGDAPWHGLSVDMTLDPPKTAAEIVAAAQLGWTSNTTPMLTELHGMVHGWHAVYREDNNNILGVVHKTNPIQVQNSDMFNAIESMIDSKIDAETAASLGQGETVFGCFKIREQYKVLDDDIDHYFVVVNDHLKCDGKITVLNTPIRVVCQNTLSAALNQTFYKLRVPVTADTSINSTYALNLINSVGDAILNLQKKAEKMVAKKIDKVYVDKMLDILFPYQLVDGVPMPTKANEQTSMTREMFLSECMGADNLGNYRGTQWQVFNALSDFDTHYFKSAEKAYDLNHRMKLLPGLSAMAEPSKLSVFLKNADKIAA